ncbi:PLC-like phosphodiesterase [Mollisia scopiformis]|uniref:PLC-like phosphodiesterase n=1 Tax=Mollisia scopiformis TaxID=149040 RepID=A0A132B4M0_MOLSC|nr:PLC-like phosphodiesterase [Mollisia scopiformis]KUJ07193.1 PLC-like phosphodiesterase [Mollisia scopiformis]
MPSKGVQCYSYIAIPGCEIQFSVPGKDIIKNQSKTFGNDHLEVDKKNIKGAFDFVGTFSFKVLHDGNQIASESVNINVLSGNLEAGTLKTMENQQSVSSNGIIVAYGFYDAGQGVAGLPSSDQCYVTVTPDYSGWMGQVAPQGSGEAGQPFSKLFLPAAHDIGMNSMQNADAVLSSNTIVDALIKIDPTFAKIAGMMSHDAVMAIAPNIVRGLAITQKDTLSTILSLGCRYFEFRPAYLHSAIRPFHPIPDVLYFSHSAIPGMAYQQFLNDVVAFLVGHPDEIVVVQLRWDGIPNECAHPTDQDLANYMSTALASSHGGLLQGSIDDMLQLTISQLRQQKKRLILFGPVDSFSTYTDPGNATLNGDSIIAEFNQLTPQLQAGKPFTNLQCQATASNVRDAVVYSVLAANADSSCLLATKPICDSKTLPWIVANAGRLNGSELVVAMNDFFDGATADVCIDWSKKRLL